MAQTSLMGKQRPPPP